MLSTFLNKIQNLTKRQKTIALITLVILLILVLTMGISYLGYNLGQNNGFSSSSSAESSKPNLINKLDGKYSEKAISGSFNPMLFVQNQIDEDRYLLNISSLEIENPLYSSFFQGLVSKLPELKSSSQVSDTSSEGLEFGNSYSIIYNDKTESYSIAKDAESKLLSLVSLYTYRSGGVEKLIYLTLNNQVFLSEKDFKEAKVIYESDSTRIPTSLISTTLTPEFLYLVFDPGPKAIQPITDEQLDATTDSSIITQPVYKYQKLIKIDLAKLVDYYSKDDDTIIPEFVELIDLDNFFTDLNKTANKDSAEIISKFQAEKLANDIKDSFADQSSSETQSYNPDSIPQDYIIESKTRFYPLSNNKLLISAQADKAYFFIYDIVTKQVSRQNLPITNVGNDNIISSKCDYDTNICYIVNFNSNTFYRIDLSKTSNNQFDLKAVTIPTGSIENFDLNVVLQTLNLQARLNTDLLMFKDKKIGFWYLDKFIELE